MGYLTSRPASSMIDAPKAWPGGLLQEMIMRRHDRPGTTNEPGLAYDFGDVVIVDPTAAVGVVGAALAARVGGDQPLVVHRLDDALILPQVAEFLNVGLSYAIGLADGGQLPVIGRGLSRRVPLDALARYRFERDRLRAAALRQMAADVQALELNDRNVADSTA